MKVLCDKRSHLWSTAFAFFLLGAGILLLLDNFGIVLLRRAWDAWPLGFIAVGLAGLFEHPRRHTTSATEAENE